MRESLNLLGGIIVCGIVNHYLRRELAQLPFFEDVLQEEVIRQRLKMWSGKEKELEETIIAEAEEDDGTNVSIAPGGEIPGRPEMNGMGVIGSQLEITTENDPKVGVWMEEKMKELPSQIGSFAESKKSKGSKKSKKSLKSKNSGKSKKSAVSKKKKAAGAAAVEPSDPPNTKDTTTKSAEENKS